MTAKERLRARVDGMSEPEAERVLAYLGESDVLMRLLSEAPDDDEASSGDEDRSADEAWAEYERGEARPLGRVREELG